MPKNSRKPSQNALIEALETRLLYSADIMSLGADANDSDEQIGALPLDTVARWQDDFERHAADEMLPAQVSEPATREVVFVAGNVADVDALLSSLDSGNRQFDIVYLDSAGDSLQQISAALAGYQDLDAVHFVAHGDAGIIDFGADQLDRDTIAANRELISGWSTALGDDADILFYGCNLAASDDGELLINELALLTGADIAASDDLTGGTATGGDWVLEYSAGAISIETAFSAEAQANWTQTLATFTVTNLDDSGTGSLRWAIDQANATGAVDTINFAVSGTITVSSGFVIDNQVIIDGSTAPGYGAPTISIDGSAVGGSAIGFDFVGGSDGSVLEGLNVHGFSLAAVELNTKDNILLDNYFGTDITGNNVTAINQTGQAIRIMDGAHDNFVIGNVVGGYGIGLLIDSSDRTTVQGNHVGIGADGTSLIANGTGIDIRDGSKTNLIGTDGDGTDDALEANVVSGNSGIGIRILDNGSDENIIAGNIVGMRADLSATAGNGGNGIQIDNGPSKSIIGGINAGNIIAGNGGHGIYFNNTSDANLILGNFIGTDSTGTEQWGNLGSGIFIENGADKVTIGGTAAGEANIIAFNAFSGGAGITLASTAPNEVGIRGNAIYGNYGLAIDLGDDGVTANDFGDGDGGPNRTQNYPGLSNATINGAGLLSVDVDTQDFNGGTYTLDIFASSSRGDAGHGEMGRYLFSVTVSGGNAFTINQPGVTLTAGEFLTATATDSNQNTSEVSLATIVTAAGANTAPEQAWIDSSTSGGFTLNEDGGNNGYLAVRNVGSMLDGLSALTVEVRFSFTASGADQQLLSYEADQAHWNDDFGVTLRADGNLLIEVIDASIVTSGYDFSALSGTGAHTLSIAWDNSGTLNVYVDGVLVFADAAHAVGLTLAGYGQFVVGQDQSGINHFPDETLAFGATFHDLRIFDDLRSASEIASTWGVTIAPTEPGLVANWTFDGASPSGILTDAVSGLELESRTLGGAAWTPGPSMLSLATSALAANGSTIGSVDSLDIDGHTFTFSFAPGGNAGGAFAIDSLTGDITVADNSLLTADSQETVTVRVTDQLGAQSDVVLTIDVTGDEYPASFVAPGSEVGDEDTDIIFSTANGNAVIVTTGSPHDPDITVTISAANGTLTLGSTANITFMNGTADGEATIVLFGNESDINAALQGLAFTPDQDYFGAASITLTTGATTSDLAGRYTFTDGGLADNSGNGNDAVLQGGSADPAAQTDSERGDVLYFDGDDGVLIPGTFGDPTAITLAAWVNVPAGQTDAIVISLGDQIRLRLDTIVGVTVNTPVSGYGSGVDVGGTGWRHIAATLDEATGTVVVYIDGQATNTFTTFMVANPNGLDLANAPEPNSMIGSSVSGAMGLGPPMAGSVDDVRIYARALTAEEIAALAGDQGTASATINLTINAVNDEQLLDINTGASVAEGNFVVIDDTMLSASDVDNSPTQLVYTITSAPANGRLELSTNPGVAITSFTQADLDAARVVFVHDGSESSSDSFDFTLDDGAGASTSGTFAFSVSAVNDEQTLNTNTGASVAEGDFVVIDNTELAGSDPDNTPAQLVYTVTSAPANGRLELSTNPGVAITSFTQADLNAGLVVYVHDGSETTGDSFGFSLDDGAGSATTGSFALTVTPTNDEQTLDINAGATVAEGNFVVIDNTVLSGSDPDNTPAQLVYTVTSAPANGRLELSTNPGVAIISFTQADLDAGLVVYVHDGSETIGDTFSFSLDDGAGSATTGSFALTVTPVNDEQTLDINTGTTVAEGDFVVIDNTVLSGSDPDNTPAQLVYTVTSVPANGRLELSTNPGVAITSFTQADLNAGLVVYVHDGSETIGDSFGFSLDDGAGSATTGSFALTVTPVNDEQTLDINAGATVAEGNFVVIDNTVLSGSDPDNTPAQLVYTVTSVPANGRLELSTNPGVAITSFTQADLNAGLVVYVHDGSETTGDSFGFSLDDGAGSATAGSFALTVTPVNDEQTLDVNTGATVAEGNFVVIDNTVLSASDVDNTPAQLIYTVTSAPANGRLELSTNPGVAITSFTQADIDAGLVVYVHDGSETTGDTFNFSLDDGAGSATTGSFALTVTPVNDEQTLDVNAGATVAEGNSVVVDNTVLSASDVDNTPAQLVYTVTSAPANGRLELSTNPGVAIISFTQADLDAGLVVYVHDGSETTGDTFSFSLDDGAGSATTGSFALTVTPTNDEQTLDVNAGATVAEGNSVVVDNTVLSASDVDNTPAQLVYTVTSVPANGRLELSTNPGVAITSFTQADLDAGLVVYVHDGSETIGDSFGFSLDDGAGSTITGSFALTVTPVNDEQTLDLNTGTTVAEGDFVIIDNTVLSGSDPDNTPAQLVYTVTSAPANGRLELSTNPGVAITSFTQADLDAGLVVYVHDGSETTVDSFGFSLDDGAGSTTTGSFALTVTPVNDEQTLDLNTGTTVAEGNFVVIDNTVVSASDVDNTPAQLVYTVTSAPAYGRLELSSNPGSAITSFTQADLDAGLVIYVHDGGDTPDDSFAFTVDDGFGTASSAVFSIAVTPVNDAPMLALQPGLAGTFTEGDLVPVLIDPSAVVSDSDSANFAGGTLTVSMTANGTTSDRLVIVAGGGLTISGTDIQVGGITVATMTGGAGAADPLQIAFNGSADAATVEQIARRIGFLNLSEDPVESTRTLSLVLTDGDGGDSGTLSRDVAVAAVNDAPAVADNGGALVFTEQTPVAIAAMLGLSDVDDTLLAGASVRISGGFVAGQDELQFAGTAAINGQWDAATGMLTLTGSASLADYEAALATVLFNNPSDTPDSTSRTIEVTVSDAAGASATVTRALGITPVNDVPVLTLPTQTVVATEQVTLALPGVGLALFDADGGSQPGTLTLQVADGSLSFVAGSSGVTAQNGLGAQLVLTGTTAQLDALLAGATDGGLNYFLDNDTPTAATTLDLNYSEGNGGHTVAAQMTLNVQAVDDTPVITLPGPGGSTLITISEGLLWVTSLLATDVDSPTVTFSIAGGADAAAFQITPDGRLSLVNPLPGDVPGDADGDGIYEVVVAGSDGNSSDLRSLSVRIESLSTPFDVPEIELGGQTDVDDNDDIKEARAPLDPALTSLIDLLATPERSSRTTDDAGSLHDGDLPAPIVLSADIIDSIAPGPDDDNIAKVSDDRSLDLLRKLLLDAPTSPAALAFDLTTEQLDNILKDGKFADAVDGMRRNMDELAASNQAQKVVASSLAVGASASLTVGFIGWLLRAGSLITGFLSAAPLWRHLDPLAILAARRRKRSDGTDNDPNQATPKHDRGLEHMFRHRGGDQ